ncbi:MAG TPA: hypothetical protein VH020_06400 [Stellaceae bacterium]|jgi:hypothetical protein|nr:hypothetical protein [Stellaceae bacterium]
MADDRKPGLAGSERFPEDRGDIKDKAGDPLANVTGGGDKDGENEGEGNKTADRHYREGVKRTVQSGQVDKKAKEAERAYDGAEGKELRRAEQQAKQHSHGEDPALNKTKH